tara:strand:+ start:8559 stop:11102 length:2544 start_codon:yes stop_codon:yes gene_type:complete
MLFVLKMMWRELRASWTRLTFFFLCLAIGVASIVSLRSLVQNIQTSLDKEAKSVLGADVSLRTEQPWSDELDAVIKTRLLSVQSVQQTRTIDVTTVARANEGIDSTARVVEVRGVEEAFPFYGAFELLGSEDYSFDLLRDNGALVAPEVLSQLNVSIGDRVIIGALSFVVRGVIQKEPGRRMGGLGLGPRILVSYVGVKDAGLQGVASRANRQLLLKVNENRIESLVDELQVDLKDSFVRVSSYSETGNRIQENLKRTENYLSLVGLGIVILGGIGVWSVTRVFIQERIRSISILKCLGSTNYQVLAIYVLQVLCLGIGGSFLGLGLAKVSLMSVPDSLTEQAALMAGISNIAIDISSSAALQGLAVGVLVSMFFAFVPLLEIRHVKPLLLMRQGGNESESDFDWVRTVTTAFVGLGLVLLAIWQAGSFEIGLYVVGGFSLVGCTLYGLVGVVKHVVSPLEKSRWFVIRHAALSLRRPGNQTKVVLLSVGLGSFFIIGIQATQLNILRAFELELQEDGPDMFMIDVQQDQADGVKEIVTSGGDGALRLIPVLRARITGVDGKTLDFDSAREARSAGLGREYTVTYRSFLEENEKILLGEFWDETQAIEPEVSIEKDLYEDRDINLGDVIHFNVMGRNFPARVTSVREVRWDDSRNGGFFFLFRPGSFGDAPHSYLAFVKGPEGSEARIAVQQQIMSRYPNVSVIDGLTVIGTVRRMLDYVALAISIVGAIALFSGSLILIGSVAMTKFQRIYESAIFKTLGVDSRSLGLMLAVEYGLLGFVAGVVGSIGSLFLTWVLTRQVFSLPWDPFVTLNIFGVIATTALVVLVGLLSSIDVLKRRPLAALHAE